MGEGHGKNENFVSRNKMVEKEIYKHKGRF